MQRRYIVLRDTTPRAERSTRSTRGFAPERQAMVFRSETHAPDSPDLTDDDEVVRYVPAVKLKLVKPMGGSTNGFTPGALPWGLRIVRADQTRFDGKGITVAVLDTGIVAGHPAFAHLDPSRLKQQDFTGEGNGDGHGHGTHCAGTIFGGAVNGTRIGIAPGIRTAIIGKVLDRNGVGSSDQLVEALTWAASNRAQVISTSLGIDFPGHVKDLENQGLETEPATSQALDDFRRTLLLFDEIAGMLSARIPNGVVVVAAGNESRRRDQPGYRIGVSLPAVTRGFISVGALGESADGLAIADFSNTGPVLSAPGVGIVSAALDGGLTSMSGTSMAAPHVAGIAALCAQKIKENPFGGELRAMLVNSVTREGLSPGILPADVGAGLVVAP